MRRLFEGEIILTLQTGALWTDDDEWHIISNCVCGGVEGNFCKHCKKVEIEKEEDAFDPEDKFICPRAVVAYNEGGYNSTGVCLDCILEVVAGLETVASLKDGE